MRREPFPGRRVYMCQSLPSVSALGTRALTAPRDAPHCPATRLLLAARLGFNHRSY